MWKKHKKLIIILLIVVGFVFFNPGQTMAPIEKVVIRSGMGIDLVKDNIGQTKNFLSLSAYTFNKKDQVKSMILSGNATTIPEARSTRQLQSNHKMVISLQKVEILSEDFSRAGIMDIVDILFVNEFMNDLGWVVVCPGKALDILQFKVDDYPSSSDYIDGMIESCKEQNFFSENYRMMDMYIRVDAQGRNLALPYIENVNNKIQITGMALFKKDRMVKKIDMEETKLMNMLREKKAKGILELKKGSQDYTSIYGDSARKVSCKKSGDKYSFTIDVSFKGDIISNTLIKELDKKPDVIRKFEDDLAQQTKKQCQDFIYKMQNEYRVDCLELGMAACAKYGRNTGVDWDEVVSNSDITVNVKVKVEGSGRGNYAVS